ncbi:serine hydrolase domain-containing protein [Kutzneria kofuensis]|uniref:CubicO group peptidase (Beta-lactamase class C family) n=1 Tax=Kutzneria kofuensis TaxID=103725 RepID=A0A7W9KHH5_9PSEU|nr:serine hydrolase domain-containing protein [Kutzneria kofuensis]MBB5892697.1 CubicO group peptidase (beta-lactamase class C family) [Kutzneria kofuensis]
MLTSEGFAHDRYAAVREAFERNDEVGASVCVTVEGETVVDLWGGFADETRTRPWSRDTIVNVYSVTKTMTSLTALLLADRGELDFDAPVARYWPEFAAGGKESVKVSHLMSHSSGLSGWREPITADVLYDWEKATALLAAQEPFWKPGTASGYHASTQGYLVGEVVRRITGRSLGTVFRQEIAEPLGADFHIGLPASEDARVADLIAPPDGPPFDAGSTELQLNAALNPELDVAVTGTRAWRGAEIPAGNGHGNARSVAEIHALLANGGVAKGKRLLSEAGCRRALEIQIEGPDLILPIRMRWGLGFAVNNGLMPNPNTVYWGGYGGSVALIDMDARMTFAYAMNKMSGTTTGDDRALGLIMAAYGM